MENIELKKQLYAILEKEGAVLHGVGDMSEFVNDELNVGVSVAIPVPASIVKDLQTAPTIEYMKAYTTLNNQLNRIVTAGANFLISQGYNAIARTTDVVTTDENRKSLIPHKTFATRAGIGWIGKSCLLVTREYGSSIRLSSLLTDAPLPLDEPITESRCGGCMRCVEACPAHALKGTLWKAGMEREELLDWKTCVDMQIIRMENATGIKTDLCGLCFAICPYTIARLQIPS